MGGGCPCPYNGPLYRTYRSESLVDPRCRLRVHTRIGVRQGVPESFPRRGRRGGQFLGGRGPGFEPVDGPRLPVRLRPRGSDPRPRVTVRVGRPCVVTSLTPPGPAGRRPEAHVVTHGTTTPVVGVGPPTPDAHGPDRHPWVTSDDGPPQ